MNRHIRHARALAALISAILLMPFSATAQDAVSVAEQSITNITSTSATFTGDVKISPWGASGYFQYGPTPDYGFQTPSQELTWSWHTMTVGMTATVNGLLPNTSYHYRTVVVDAKGWGTAYGDDGTFTTPPAAGNGGLMVTGNSASSVTDSPVGTVNEWVPADVPMLIGSRWSRAWQVAKTTLFTDTVTLGFDFATGGITTYGSNYMLLYRPGTSGYFTPLFVAQSSSSQNWVQFLLPGAQLQPGQYTLGQAIGGPIVRVPEQDTTIQGAIFAAEGGIVVVAPGTYYEEVSMGGYDVTIMSYMGITGDTSYASRTILDGDNGGPRGEPNPVISVWGHTGTFIGLTIQNGYSEQGGGASVYFRAEGSSWTNCYFYNNTASISGAGFYTDGEASNSFTNCIFKRNSVNDREGSGTVYGGGICQMSSGNMSITGCLFDNNAAADDPREQGVSGYGGAIYVDSLSDGHLSVSNSRFALNLASRAGGAIYNGGGGSVSTYNCVFQDNSSGGIRGGKAKRKEGDAASPSAAVAAVEGGGSIHTANRGRTLIVQSTIYDTATGDFSGGVRADTGDVDVISSIVWTGNGSDAVSANAGIVRVAYSNIAGTWSGPGAGNIGTDPMFSDVAAGDFRLRPGSPAIDSGMPDPDGDGRTWETDVEDRDPDGTRIDMGALPYLRQPPAGLAVAAIRSLIPSVASSTVTASLAPSPIRSTGTLSFRIERAGDVRIELADARGNRVAILADGRFEAGPHTAAIDASSLPSGLYFYRLSAGGAAAQGAVVVAR